MPMTLLWAGTALGIAIDVVIQQAGLHSGTFACHFGRAPARSSSPGRLEGVWPPAFAAVTVDRVARAAVRISSFSFPDDANAPGMHIPLLSH